MWHQLESIVLETDNGTSCRMCHRRQSITQSPGTNISRAIPLHRAGTRPKPPASLGVTEYPLPPSRSPPRSDPQCPHPRSLPVLTSTFVHPQLLGLFLQQRAVPHDLVYVGNAKMSGALSPSHRKDHHAKAVINRDTANEASDEALILNSPLRQCDIARSRGTRSSMRLRLQALASVFQSSQAASTITTAPGSSYFLEATRVLPTTVSTPQYIWGHCACAALRKSRVCRAVIPQTAY